MSKYLVIACGKHYIVPMTMMGDKSVFMIREESKNTGLQYLIYKLSDITDSYYPFLRVFKGNTYNFDSSYTNVIEVSLDG